jgi:hypothetical protein
MDKVINPVTGKWITVNKDTYNKLINNGYVLVNGRLVLKSSLPLPLPTLPTEIIVEEIIPHMMNPGHVLSTCKTLRIIFEKQSFWEKMYDRYFCTTSIKSKVDTYYEAYKICYNLFFLGNNVKYIYTWYLTTYIHWTGIVNSKRLIYSMTYMQNLETIEFRITNPFMWDNYDIKYYAQMLPKIKSITIKYDKQI